MNSNPGEASRAVAEASGAAQYLSPIRPDLEELSDAESFSRTIPQIEDDEELDMPAADTPPAAQQGATPLVLRNGRNATSQEEQDDRDGQDELEAEAEGSPSVQDSLPSSPASARASSQNSTLKSRKRASLQPFDRRFSGMFLNPQRAISPSIASALRPGHSRHSSAASTITPSQVDETDTPQAPWEVVRWAELKKLSSKIYSEVGRRNYGKATTVAIGASIVVGTSKGLALVFDYHQNLVATIGLGTKAIECGSVTALGISADHTTVAVGHATGHIFTWEIARPAKPFLHIFPLPEDQVANRKSDGHVYGSAVVHVGFLGTRHTALVTADNHGMAFSHLATRGLGAVARSVKTARLLGRYPTPQLAVNNKPQRASSVLAFASLPLGNVEEPTDGVGLTALLTPYLLVIVSTTPIAETQFKTPRPKEIPPHSTLSGCLAWFPAVKLRRPDATTKSFNSKTKLVYCWSHVLTVLDVEAEPTEERDRPPVLHFHPRSRWRCQEAIVAVQWLSRSVIGVLTISQQLIIIEDNSMRVTDSFDLLQKHIFHQDIFSSQLRSAVESLNDEDDSLHGVVADAFFMSFRTYKGRLFLLGFNDIFIGTLSNWADRLVALLENGEYIEAIRLAEMYYTGASDRITVGLPEDNEARHEMVREKVVEIMSASIKYAFSRKSRGEEHAEELIPELLESCFSACLALQDTDFLFEDLYEPCHEDQHDSEFFQTLEPYILTEDVTSMPTEVFKRFVRQYEEWEKMEQLETLICCLDVRTMDIDQTATVCKRYQLYDALIYVWNRSIGEYVTPLIELLMIVKSLLKDDETPERYVAAGEKVFPYLAHVLTGRAYPGGEDLEDEESFRAKADVYGYLFSGRSMAWPTGSKSIFEPFKADTEYPYLKLLLHFSASDFLSMLNEAFEDFFLNEETSSPGANGARDRRLPTRQTIVGILLNVMSEGEFESEDTIFLDMFIARNLPKFPQFIGLPGNTLDKIIRRLCDYPSEEIADDCQLSVEYLLSYYHPSDVDKLTPVFREAGFYRVLKSVYRSSKQYPKLLETYFEDANDKYAVFGCIGDCLRSGSDLTTKQRREVQTIVITNAQLLAGIDTPKAAKTILQYCPDLLDKIFEELDKGSYVRFVYLKTLLEKTDLTNSPWDEKLHHQFDEQYVRLLCTYEPLHVAAYIDIIKSGDLRLQEVLPAIESSGAVDAAVMLLVRDGLLKDAMQRLIIHMQALGSGLSGLIGSFVESPDVASTTEGVEDLLSDVNKYTKVGIWLCQGQTNKVEAGKKSDKAIRDLRKTDIPESELTVDELLWLDLIDTIVSLAKLVNETSNEVEIPSDFDHTSDQISSSLRTAVQDSFTALLSATSRPTLPTADVHAPTTQPHPTFLIILRAFLNRAARSSPSLSDLRAVLAEIFQAYAFEQRILDLANTFLDKDLFAHVEDAWARRQKGWRPRGNVCELCGRRVWGPGAGGSVWAKWEDSTGRREQHLQLKRTASSNSVTSPMLGRGKGRATPQEDDPNDPALQLGAGLGLLSPLSVAMSPMSIHAPDEDDEALKRAAEARHALVIFACRHVWHRDCLERTLAISGGRRDEWKCPADHDHE